MSFLKFLNEAKKKSTSFVVERPLGESFCSELIKAAKEIGLTAEEDPMLEGQDQCGFFISKNPALVQKAIELAKGALDDGDDSPYLEIQNTKGLTAISMDWKYFDPEEVAKDLAEIGIKMTYDAADDTFLITLRA